MVAAALEWLLRLGSGPGIPETDGEGPISAPLTAACLHTAFQFGQLDCVERWTAGLLALERPDGAYPAQPHGASIFDTAQVAAGLLALEPQRGELRLPLARACRFLVSRIDAAGHFTPDPAAAGSLDFWAPEPLQLAALAPLLSAARRLCEPAWEAAAGRAIARLRRSTDLTAWRMPLHAHAQVVAALVELGLLDEARRALALPAALQRRDGSVPARPHSRWISTAGVAQLAVLWYRLGERERADRALAWLRRCQERSGPWPAGRGRPAGRCPSRPSAWTVKYVLDAAVLQVASAFRAPLASLPETIDSADGRLQAVRQWLVDKLPELPPSPRIADLGCGTGRFLRHLCVWFPHVRWVGIDVSSRLLERVPAGVEVREGSLLRLPARSASFDAAFAVESLEHALWPRQAAAELSRVVRPGGHVLIIDKHRAKQPLSEHQPWEQWFLPEEVSGWLAQSCDQVQVRSIPHGPHRVPTGLFLCWTARRRAA